MDGQEMHSEIWINPVEIEVTLIKVDALELPYMIDMLVK